MLRIAVVTLLAPASNALVFGIHARVSATRSPAAHSADFGGFEKSFRDELYREEFLDKNKILHDLRDELPSLLFNGGKANGYTLREGIDEAREAGASLRELKPFVEALKKADPSLVTETDEAILKGAEQAVLLAEPQPAKPPSDSYLTAEQFEALRQASMSQKPSWDESLPGGCPAELKGAFGNVRDFYGLLRNPREDPTPVMWAAVRREWPVLGGVPDDELQKNLVECKKEFCDFRFV